MQCDFSFSVRYTLYSYIVARVGQNVPELTSWAPLNCHLAFLSPKFTRPKIFVGTFVFGRRNSDPRS